ncbi:hypothetical protein PAXINDRAFT_16536 [Paxillus involutus ATCC 200175]|uniref:2OGFeDO JBP1/TET oxygenase domain-containing protein n=1 Tax=Paxillus involutus ATCC 200175 TaxID=664439 RepID=A0A0C9TTB0_PAXIN|nr:hypothetical protein PAXINDRAFT_16536 [Paxillus involutus ATCC 200175]
MSIKIHPDESFYSLPNRRFSMQDVSTLSHRRLLANSGLSLKRRLLLSKASAFRRQRSSGFRLTDFLDLPPGVVLSSTPTPVVEKDAILDIQHDTFKFSDLVSHVIRILLFIPWCAAVGGALLLSPNHVELVAFRTGYLPSPKGLRRFARWADCAYPHVMVFFACVVVVLWVDRSIPLGEDDQQSLYLVIMDLASVPDAVIAASGLNDERMIDMASFDLLSRVRESLEEANVSSIWRQHSKGNHSNCEKASSLLWPKWTSVPDLCLEATASELEWRRAADTIAFAVLNHIYVNWDVDRYSEKAKCSPVKVDNEARQAKLGKFFELKDVGKMEEPCTIVDRHGRILLWYLPKLMYPSRVAMVNNSLLLLRPILDKSMPNMSNPEDRRSWRLQGFVDESDATYFGRGKITMSPGYFMQSHERMCDPVVPSASLRLKEVQAWLAKITPIEEFLNEILKVVHPRLHKACGTVMSAMKLDEALAESANSWPSLFGAMELIVNRITPWHQDSGAASGSYDLLLSLGCNESVQFEVSDIGGSFTYGPGALLYLTGKVLRHSVPEWEGEERVVLTHFTKDAVQDRFLAPRPVLPNIDQYLL